MINRIYNNYAKGIHDVDPDKFCDDCYAESRELAVSLGLHRLELIKNYTLRAGDETQIQAIEDIIQVVKHDTTISVKDLVEAIFSAYAIATKDDHPESSFKRLAETLTILNANDDFNKPYEGL